MTSVARSAFRPKLVLAAGPEGSPVPPLLRDRTCVDDRATAYLCRNFSCLAPVTETDKLRKELDALSS